jgi:hypothetical protein
MYHTKLQFLGSTKQQSGLCSEMHSFLEAISAFALKFAKKKNPAN